VQLRPEQALRTATSQIAAMLKAGAEPAWVNAEGIPRLQGDAAQWKKVAAFAKITFDEAAHEKRTKTPTACQ
jgi:hypothetical protein